MALATTSTTVPSPTGPSSDFSQLAVLTNSWPVCVFLCVVLFLFIFRRQIEKFIDRIQKSKFGPAGAEFESPLEKETAKTTTEEKQVSEEVYGEEKKKEEEKEDAPDPDTYDGWRIELIWAALMKNKDRVEVAYRKMLELSSDPVMLRRSEIIYWSWKHTLGDTEAIPKLKEFLKYSEIEYDVKMALGFCYFNSEDCETSATFYAQALKLAKEEKEKVTATDRYAAALYGNGQKREAIKALEQTLAETKEETSKIALFTELADLYEKEKEYENRAMIIEQILELKPNDASLIFKAGYSYSNSKYEELSLLHYINAKRIDPDDGAVRNNLGVQYERLEMPFRSIANYNIAAKQGETLALSNLAYRLMNAGFETEAKEKLTEAQKAKDPHANVAQAISDLTKRKESEDERESEVNKKALTMRKFFLGFGAAKYTPSTILTTLSGDWKVTGTDIIFHVTIQNNIVIATWQEKVFASSAAVWDYKFVGEIHNNTSDVFITRDESPYGKGKLFCSKDGTDLYFMSVGEYKSKQVLKFQKI